MSALTRHWELKLLALVVSMVLWAFVMTSERTDVVVAAPIELDGIPPGLEVKGERPESTMVGAWPRSRRTSSSRQFTPMRSPVPSAFSVASLAAKRAAKCGMGSRRRRQYAISCR